MKVSITVMISQQYKSYILMYYLQPDDAQRNAVVEVEDLVQVVSVHVSYFYKTTSCMCTHC